ncbi:MAG: DMT family transporter [Verrucomicrobia bacterium]|nr:DMT family transporter [Verrucomicrobiota bacterium]
MSLPPPEISARRAAIRMLVLCTVFWAVSFPVMKALALEQQRLLPGANSWFLTALGVLIRFGSAGILMALFAARARRRISPREIEQGIVMAVFGVGGILLQMDGLSYTAASTSAFLTQGYCVVIPVWTALVHRRAPAGKVLFSIALVGAGAVVLAGVDFKTFRLGRGELETLAASVMFAGQILALENPRYAANDALRFSAVMFLAMSLCCVPLLLATAPGAAACWRAYASPAALAFMAVLVVVCTLGGYLLMNRWQRGVTATEAGLVYSAEPVFASLYALFLPAWFSAWTGVAYPNEQLTVRLLVGGGLITAANVILQSPWSKTKN